VRELLKLEATFASEVLDCFWDCMRNWISTKFQIYDENRFCD
jgi:hypothetical protein